jgi:hypothetical protein
MSAKLGLMLREEHGLRVFENRMLRRIFGPKRYKVTGGWRQLDNEELHNLYHLSSIIRMFKSRKMRWEGHVAQMEQKRNAYRVLVGKVEGKRLLGRPAFSLMHLVITVTQCVYFSLPMSDKCA